VRRLLVLLAVAAALLAPAAAQAHPLGNFTTNRYSQIELSGNRVYVLYVLDLAEVPTFQERNRVQELGRARYGAALQERLARGLRLAVAGKPLLLEPVSRALRFPDGVGGLKTTRLELVLRSERVPESNAPLALSFQDTNYSTRQGWQEIVVRAGEDAQLASASVPAESVSDALRTYPRNLLRSPLDVDSASARFTPGEGDGVAPPLGRGDAAAPSRSSSRSEGGFASLIDEDDLSAGVIAVSLLIALFWGAAHALSPGHGKAIVAAFMVGSRGKARHAFMLGGIVTVTHTIGVFTLGLITLALSEFVVPEDLYPWLNLVSALLVVAVGITVLRVRILDWLRPRRKGAQAEPTGHWHEGHDHDHPHDHAHDHDHEQAHDHDHPHDHDHGHQHGPGGHSHVPEPGSGLRGIVAVGISGGLLPCPTALVVLLAAISLQRVGYGLVLILAFSVGLAAVVSGIGLLAISSRRLFSRTTFDGPIVRALPAVSAVIILGLGVVMTLRALPTIV